MADGTEIKTTNEYQNGLLVEKTQGDTTTTYLYDSHGNLIEENSSSGNRIIYSHKLVYRNR